MKIEKTFEIDAPRDQVWEFLSSPERVGECFPGCEEVKPLGGNKYKATIKVEIGPIKTVFNVDFEENEKRPPEFLAYTSQGEESHKASRLKAVSTLSLSSLEEFRTQVVYTSELSIVGRLGKFGAGMMKKKADVLGDEFAEELRRQIAGEPAIPLGVPGAEKHYPSSRQVGIAAALAAVLLLLIAWLTLR